MDCLTLPHRRQLNDAQRWAKIMLTRGEPLGARLTTYDGLSGVVVDQADPACIVLRSDAGTLFKVGRLEVARDYSVVTGQSRPATPRNAHTPPPRVASSGSEGIARPRQGMPGKRGIAW
jgi:hypothetical protein